jgi:hypothetical protein
VLVSGRVLRRIQDRECLGIAADLVVGLLPEGHVVLYRKKIDAAVFPASGKHDHPRQQQDGRKEPEKLFHA